MDTDKKDSGNGKDKNVKITFIMDKDGIVSLDGVIPDNEILGYGIIEKGKHLLVQWYYKRAITRHQLLHPGEIVEGVKKPGLFGGK